MLRCVFVIILVFLVVPVFGDVFDDALAQKGLTKQTARFDQIDLGMWNGDLYKLPYFDMYHKDPYRTPERIKTFREQVSTSAGSVFGLVNYPTGMLGELVRRSLLGNPAADSIKQSDVKDALRASIIALWNATGKKPGKSYIRKLEASASKVPAEIAKPAAILIFAEVDALKWRNLAFSRLTPKYKLQDLYNNVISEIETDYDFTREDMMALVDLKLLFVGAENLAAGVDAARDMLINVKDCPNFEFEIDTPAGKIVLNNNDKDIYQQDESYTLIIDMAGDDTYYSGACTNSFANFASILIDMSGNDKYLETPELLAKSIAEFNDRKKWKSRPNTCGAVMGYSFLLDIAGDDLYRSVNNSQGYAAYGASVLMDYAGNDVYDCYQQSQGAAFFGIAALSDRIGNDTYRCFAKSQGYGSTKGFGLLVDAVGDDKYTADTTNIDFPSPQDAKHNSSLAQGMGYGSRADYKTGHSLAGGIGALVDLTGNDVYVADLMAQGMGYWYALGILSDGAGDDSYTGYWYNQGSAAHFAVGIINDVSGNDKYNGPCSMVQGAGHDFSLGYLLDEGGNDIYNCSGISLGGGNDNGIGIFWDVAGDDTYNPSGGFTLGRSNITSRGTIRDYNLCLGLFIDTGGIDTYPSAYPFAANGQHWLQDGLNVEKPLKADTGIGRDVGD